MEYIRSQNRKQYVDEITDLSFETLKLIKDPRCKVKKLSDIIPAFIAMDIVMIAASVFMIMALFKYDSILLRIFAAVVALCFMVITLTLIGFFARKKTAKGSDGTIDCDEEGITFNSSSGESKTKWSSIRCIRVFRYAMVLIPKERGKTPAVIVPVENLENIESCLKRYNADIEIIR